MLETFSFARQLPPGLAPVAVGPAAVVPAVQQHQPRRNEDAHNAAAVSGRGGDDDDDDGDGGGGGGGGDGGSGASSGGGGGGGSSGRRIDPEQPFIPTASFGSVDFSLNSTANVSSLLSSSMLLPLLDKGVLHALLPKG